MVKNNLMSIIGIITRVLFLSILSFQVNAEEYSVDLEQNTLEKGTTKVVEEPEIFDFKSLYQMMIKNNGAYQSAFLRYKASKYDANKATSTFLPSISLNGSYGKISEKRENIDQPFDVRSATLSNVTPRSPSLGGISFEGSSVPNQGDYESSSASIRLLQPIIDKQKWNNIRRSKSEAKEAFYDFTVERERLILSLLGAYTGLLNSNDECRILNNELKDLRKHQELTKRRYEEGLGTLIDFYEAQSRLQLAESNFLQAKFDQKRFHNEISVLVGKRVKLFNQFTENFEIQLDDALIEVNIERAESNEVKLAKQKVKSAKYELKRRKSSFSPTLNLTAQSSYNATSFSSVSNEANNYSDQVMLELTIPLFSSFGDYADVKSASSLLEAEKALLANTKLESDNNIRTNLESYEINYYSLVSLQKAYQSSKKALALREKAFLEGVSSNLDLLDALRDSYRAERSWRSAVYKFIESKLALIASYREINDLDINNVNSIFLIKTKVKKENTQQEVVGEKTKTYMVQSDTNKNAKKVSLDKEFKNSQLKTIKSAQLIMENLAKAWANSWSRKSIGDYLSFYGERFVPRESLSTKKNWEKSRRENFAKNNKIKVKLENISVIEDVEVFKVVFKQRYESDQFTETIVKQLTFEKNDADLSQSKIIKEQTLDRSNKG